MWLRLLMGWAVIMGWLGAIGQKQPIDIAIIGLTHSHVHGVFNSAAKADFNLIGIVESNAEVVAKYAAQYHFSPLLVYPDLASLLQKQKPVAVAAFGNIYDHLAIVQQCAPLGIHVMVEKPLAVSLAHARQIEKLAQKHHIHVLTNYETSWYPTNRQALQLVHADSIGQVTKVVVRDGHKGPKNIGVPGEFLQWLTDPVLNGGGAITDFGCYGANLLTCLFQGKKPLQVQALTRQLQPQNHPKVDDEAIVLLNYDSAVGIIEASWNWPIGRKDMEIYGRKGAIYADNKHQLRLRIAEGYDGFAETATRLPDLPNPYHDAFAYLAAVVRGDVVPDAFDVSALPNNMLVMRILDAAMRSAKKGRAVKLRN